MSLALFPQITYALDLECDVSLDVTQNPAVNSQEENDSTHLFPTSQSDTKNFSLQRSSGDVEAGSYVQPYYVPAGESVNLIDLGVNEESGSVPSSVVTLGLGSAFTRLGLR